MPALAKMARRDRQHLTPEHLKQPPQSVALHRPQVHGGDDERKPARDPERVKALLQRFPGRGGGACAQDHGHAREQVRDGSFNLRADQDHDLRCAGLDERANVLLDQGHAANAEECFGAAHPKPCARREHDRAKSALRPQGSSRRGGRADAFR